MIKLLLYIDMLQVIAFVIFFACLRVEARRTFNALDISVALAIPVVGLFGRYLNLYYAFLFIVPLLSIGNPGQLVRRYLLVLPLFPELGGNWQVGSLYLGSFSGILAFNLGALVALATIGRARARIVPAIEIAVWLFFVVALVMATRGIPLTGVARSIVTVVLQVVPPFYVVARCVRTPRIASDAMLAMLMSGTCNAVIAVFESRRGWPLYQSFATALNVPVEMSSTLSIRAGFLRAQGPVWNSGTLGLVLALALFAVLTQRTRLRPGGRWLLVVLFAVGIVACQSRGSWLAALVGVALMLIYERRTVLVAIFAGGGIIGGEALVSLLPQEGRLSQLVGRSGDAQFTAQYRSNLLTRGLEEVARHPVTGQTRDQLQVSMNDMRQGQHIIDFVNTHLFVALTGGLGGLALWLAAWLIPLVVAWRLRRRVAAHLDGHPLALPVAMVGACFACVALTSLVDRIIPLIMLSIGTMSAFVRIARTHAPPTMAAPAGRRAALVASPPRPAKSATLSEPAQA